jgi:hypothetical protein
LTDWTPKKTDDRPKKIDGLVIIQGVSFNIYVQTSSEKNQGTSEAKRLIGEAIQAQKNHPQFKTILESQYIYLKEPPTSKVVCVLGPITLYVRASSTDQVKAEIRAIDRIANVLQLLPKPETITVRRNA